MLFFSLIHVIYLCLIQIHLALAGSLITCDAKIKTAGCPLSKRSREVILGRSNVKRDSQFAATTSSQYAPIDGFGNNMLNKDWGSTDSQCIRSIVPDSFVGDGSTPVGASRPSPRLLSNSIFGRSEDLMSTGGGNVLIILWGQFMAHDLVLSASNNSDVINMTVPKCDSNFDPMCLGNITLPFTRQFTTPDKITGRRIPLNFITSFIDASNVYGSDAQKAQALRSGFGGQLQTSGDDLLPQVLASLEEMATAATTSGKYVFFAGDVRANENPGLQSLHTLFVREHNRLATEYSKTNPLWDDEQLYQSARKMVMAFIQRITFEEYTPLTIGGSLPTYMGYNPMVDPRLDVFFAGCAFRYGHSGAPSLIDRVDKNSVEILQGPLILRDVLFNPKPVRMQVRNYKRMESIPLYVIDSLITNELRNFFPNQPFDLGAWNIQRGRDLGIPSYNQARYAFGMTPVQDFYQISSQLSTQNALKLAYKNVDEIDAYVGGRVGPLFAKSIREQLIRLRDGDRFYYLNGGRDAVNGGPTTSIYSDDEIKFVDSSTLANIILRNTDNNVYPAVAFQVPKCASSAFGGSIGCGGLSISSSNSSTNGDSTLNSTISLSQYSMGTTMLLQWRISDGSITLIISSNLADGWFAFGFGTGMVGADMIIVTKSDGTLKAQDYSSDSSRFPRVETTTLLSAITQVDISPTGFQRTVSVTRKL
ncbi:hypothetical protein HK096_001464, partial [Nowakowskiella sp. JEL0078]